MLLSPCCIVCLLAHVTFPLLTCLFACPCHFPTGHLSVSSPMSPSHCWLVYFLAHFTFCYCLKIHVDFSFLSCCFLDQCRVPAVSSTMLLCKCVLTHCNFLSVPSPYHFATGSSPMSLCYWFPAHVTLLLVPGLCHFAAVFLTNAVCLLWVNLFCFCTNHPTTPPLLLSAKDENK